MMRTPYPAPAALLALALLPLCADALAAPAPCGNRDDLIKGLRNDYKEEPVAMGIDREGRMLEVLAAPSGTWTILITSPTGTTCLVSNGTVWEPLIPASQEPKV